MQDTQCPEPSCGLPGEILDRVVIPSTDGPVEHVRLLCIGGHRFFMPAEMLPSRHPDRERRDTRRAARP